MTARCPYKRADMWTEAEDSVILASQTSAQAAQVLTHRTQAACAKRRSNLRKLGRAPQYLGPVGAWSPEEIALLRTKMSMADIALRTGRTANAVKRRRYVLRQQGRL